MSVANVLLTVLCSQPIDYDGSTIFRIRTGFLIIYNICVILVYNKQIIKLTEIVQFLSRVDVQINVIAIYILLLLVKPYYTTHYLLCYLLQRKGNVPVCCRFAELMVNYKGEFFFCLDLIQSDHLYRKPGNVRDFTKAQGSVSEKTCELPKTVSYKNLTRLSRNCILSSGLF